MTQYTDYTFYTGQYGGELTEEQFRRVIVPVSAHIRRITFDRADRSMEEVQHAACACCDLLYADQAAKAEHQGREVASENTDGYSVSYVQEQGLSLIHISEPTRPY